MSFDNNRENNLRDIDEGLNERVLNAIQDIYMAFSRGEYEQAFRGSEFLFKLIEMHDFEKKDYLIYLSNQIKENLERINSKVTNEQEAIELIYKNKELKQQISQYISLIPQAYDSLGKWFKVIKRYNDIDARISEETFLTSETLIKEKIEDLKKLKSEELLKLFNPNHIHDAHARYLINLAIKGK